MMKINHIFKGLAVMALAVSFAQCAGNTGNPSATNNVSNSSAPSNLKVAYVDVDSLLSKYQFCVDMNEAMMKKEENVRLELNKKAAALEKNQKEFQTKYENNAFLSQERAQQEYNRLMKAQQDLQALSNKRTNELANENAQNNLQLRDSINTFIKEYNKTKGYHLILSNTGFDNLLYADSAFNITEEIVNGLNARYINKK